MTPRIAARWAFVSALFVTLTVANTPPANAVQPGTNGRIAFVSDRNGGSEIYTITPEGEGLKRLTNEPRLEHLDPAWSPDGKRIAYVGRSFACCVAAFTSWTVTIMNADGDDVRSVAGYSSSAGTLSVSGPSWSPDGRFLVWARNRTATSVRPGGGELIIADLATGQTRTLVDLDYSEVAQPAWSPDGSSLAFIRRLSGPCECDQQAVYRVPSAGGVPSRVSEAIDTDPYNTGYYGLSWSPDGSRLAFSFSVGDLRLVSASGGTSEPVGFEVRGSSHDPVWSPDGTELAFTVSDGDAGWHVWRSPADGGDAHPFLDGSSNHSPDWQRLTPPETTILTGPPATTHARSATFTFSADKPSAFACSLDGASWEPCRSGMTLSSLAFGSHTFRVLATDVDGTREREPASRSWTVEPRSAPTTRITSAPARWTTSRTATFRFAADSEDARFECRIDARGWRPCSSGFSATQLSLKRHVFRVRATDSDGNVEPKPPSFRWSVIARSFASSTAIWGRWYRYEFARHEVRFRSLAVRNAPAGATILVRCFGPGCPARHHRVSLRRGRRSLDVLAGLQHRRLFPGARVDVRVTKPGYIGIAKAYCVRHAKRVKIVKYEPNDGRPTCRHAPSETASTRYER